MTKCAVLFCKNYSDRSPNISFHLFPKDPSRKRKWVEAVRREETWIPTIHHRICSLHFTPESYSENSKKQKKLYKDAIPTLCLPQFQARMISNLSENTDKPTNEAPDQEKSILSNLSGHSNPAKVKESPSTQRLKRKIQEQNRKIKRLQYYNRCLKKKVASLQEILDSMAYKILITDKDKITVLEKNG